MTERDHEGTIEDEEEEEELEDQRMDDAPELSQALYTYYVRPGGARPRSLQYLRHDFLANTRYELVISELLRARGVWKRVFQERPDPELDLVWLGTDINTALNSEPFFMSERWQRGEASYHEKYKWALDSVVERLAPRVAKFRGVYKNCRVFAKSRITNRIPIITVLTTDKAVQCQLIQQACKEWHRFVPPFLVFDTKEVLSTPELFKERLGEFLSQHQGVRWVLRPTSGSRQKCVTVIQRSRLLQAIPNEIQEEEALEYSRWILSKFVLSFLWRLQGPAESPKLLDTHMKHPVLCPPADATTTRPTQNPIALEGLHYNDEVGRTNKARFWFAVEVLENEVRAFLYDCVQFELSGKEYVGTKFDLNKIIPENGLNHFRKTYNLDKVTAQRAYDLDFCHNVEAQGENFDKVHPLGQGAWQGVVVPNLRKITRNLVEMLLEYVIHRSKAHCRTDPRGQAGAVHEGGNGGDANFFGTASSSTSTSTSTSRAISSFQYFGTDILVDDAGTVWVLEINSRPWCGYDRWWETWDPEYKHCQSVWTFFDSLLQTTVDTHFPPTKVLEPESKKRWELVGSYPRPSALEFPDSTVIYDCNGSAAQTTEPPSNSTVLGDTEAQAAGVQAPIQSEITSPTVEQ